ncbi:Cytoplasmic dynein 2 heavy chain 1 [Halotydeus destructor]|nr:Cytoplasmic dynein 2 heavy chain 1 [Halotydeus destructor]
MGDLVYQSVAAYFANELGTIYVTPEQRATTEEFLARPEIVCLVVRRDDRYSNALSFACHGELQGSSGDALVFIKSAIRVASPPVPQIAPPVPQIAPAAAPPVPQMLPSFEPNPNAINDTQLIANLREKVEDTLSSGTGLLNVLSTMRKYTKMDTVMGAMKKERSQLLTKVLDWAEDCVTAEHVQLRSNDVVDKIAAIRAREGKIRAVIKVCDNLCGDLDGYSNCKKSLEQLARDLAEECNRLYKEWCNQCASVSLDKHLQCIEIESHSQLPVVTFDPKLVKLAKDCRQLRTIAFTIPQVIAEKEVDAVRYGNIARELKEIVNFYCTVGDQILTSQKPMLIDAATAFTALLESKERISWDKEPVKLRAWLDQLREFAKAFSTENRHLRHRHQDILEILVPLFDSTPSRWRLSMGEAATIIREIDGKYNNTIPWKRHWDHQLYKLLEYHFNDALLRSEGWLGFGSSGLTIGPPQTSYGNRPTTAASISSSSGSEPYRIDLSFVSGKASLKPPLEEIKAKIYTRIKKFLMMPQSFKGFIDVTDGQESIFSAIYLRSFFSFPLLYSKANEIIRELRKTTEVFQEWTSLFYIMQRFTNDTTGMSEF